MNGYPTVALKDAIVSADSGFACGTKDPGGLAQIRMNNIETDGSWDWSQVRRVPAEKAKPVHYVEPGDVLFNATNSPQLVGKSACFAGFTEAIVFSNHFVRLRADKSSLDPGFLARWLNVLWQSRFFETRCTQWVNQATFRKQDLLALQIPLPPLPEQKRIARILDAADALRAKRREALAQLDALIQSAFLDMFGDPVTNPMGWEVLELGDLAEFINGDRGKNYPSKSDFLENGVPFINAGHLIDGEVSFAKMNYISKDRYGRLGSGKTRPMDILYCLRGSLGKSAIVRHTGPAAIASSLVIIRPSEECNVEYLFLYLVSPFGKREIRRFDTGSSQPNLSAASVKKYRICAPPLDLQHRFASIVESIERQKSRQRAHLAELDTLFASLQSRAFAGEL